MTRIIVCTIIAMAIFVVPSSATKCQRALGRFISAESEFTGCVLENSEPSNFCLNCSTHRTKMIDAYTFLTLEAMNDTNPPNHKCFDDYFDHNQLNLVGNLYNYKMTTWSNAFCDDCWVWNGTNATSRSPTTTTFFTKYDKYSECTSNYTKTDVCTYCVGYYELLSEYYDNIKTIKDTQICFDITDMINKTRKAWSSDFLCCNDKQTSLTAFYVAASVVGSTPLIFYLIMYLTTRRMDRNQSVLLNDRAEESEDGPSTSTASTVRLSSPEVGSNKVRSDPVLDDSSEAAKQVKFEDKMPGNEVNLIAI